MYSEVWFLRVFFPCEGELCVKFKDIPARLWNKNFSKLIKAIILANEMSQILKLPQDTVNCFFITIIFFIFKEKWMPDVCFSICISLTIIQNCSLLQNYFT